MLTAPYSSTLLSPEVLRAYEALPERYLFLTPELLVLTATNAYLAATGIVREQIVGRSVYDIFPENPDEPSVASKERLHASFARVLATGLADQLPMQRYDVRGPGPEAVFEEKYWRVQNSPVLAPDGSVLCIINQVSDVTELVQQGHRIEDLSREVDLTRALIEKNRLLMQQLHKANAILDTIGEAYLELSLTGEFTYLNRQAEQMLAVSKDELLGQSIWQTNVLRVSAESQHIIRRALDTGQRAEGEYLCSILGRWVYMSATPAADSLIVLLYDIEEVKQGRERLRQEHQRLKESQAIGHIGSFEVDAGSQRIYWTDELYRIHGLEPQSEAITVEKALSLLHPDDLPFFEKLMWQVAESAPAFSLVHRIRRHDGSVRIVETRVQARQGEEVRLYGTVQDMTEMKQAEKEVRESAAQFQTLVENTPDLITRWDPDLRLLFANGAFCQRMHQPLSALLGKTNLDMHHHEAVAGPWMAKLRLVFSSARAQDHYNSAETATGTKYFYSRLVPEIADDGTVRSVLALAREITDIKRLEKEHLRLQLSQQKQLLNAVLEAQEVERRRIAESLHNGLGQVLYATKLQLEQLVVEPGRANSERQATALRKAGEFLSDAISTTRTISHELIPTTLEDFGLEAAIRDVCRHMSHGTLRLQCQVVGRGPRLDKYLDLALFRLVQELVNNVVKHAGATRGFVTLTRQPHAVQLAVQDNGRGFDPQHNSTQGIGLKTIRDRVKLLNGTTRVEAVAGQGTTVVITIPAVSDDVEWPETPQLPTT